MNIPEKDLIDSALDLVVFFQILSPDMKEQIDFLASNLDQTCIDNPKLDVDVLHTGSGFEGLSLPHLETSDSWSVWNTDADHMVVRKDINVTEGKISRDAGLIEREDSVWSKGEKMRDIVPCNSEATKAVEVRMTQDEDAIDGKATCKSTLAGKGYCKVVEGQIAQNKDILSGQKEPRQARISMLLTTKEIEPAEATKGFSPFQTAPEFNINQDSTTKTKVAHEEAAQVKSVDVEQEALIHKQKTDAGKKGGNTKYIYEGQHKGYVIVSSVEFGWPADASTIEKHCLKNAEFVENNKHFIPLGQATMMSTRETLKGPSRSMRHQHGSFLMDRDIVYSLKMNSWPSQAREWLERERDHGWPTNELISAISQRGCHVVPVGSHGSEINHYEWRISFSLAELVLTKCLAKTVKLAYSILKALIKSAKNEAPGLAMFSSYHLKTVLLWLLEKEGTALWTKRTLAENILVLLDCIIAYYRDGKLPNYFIPDNDMIDHYSYAEILAAHEALIGVRKNIGLTLCRYIETSQALPVFFDQPLDSLFRWSPPQFVQVCKYNFLAMALVSVLQSLKASKGTVVDKTNAGFLLKKAQSLHTALKFDSNTNYEGDDLNIDATSSAKEPSVGTVLLKLEEFLAEDQMKVIQTSAVILAVFNLFLALHPTACDKVGVKSGTPDYYRYITIPQFKDCLFWAARQHEKHCDAIYEFVVKVWVTGPRFHTDNPDAFVVMKLLMIMLGQPTKQAKAITASLVKRSVEGNRFLIMRVLASYLLHVHPESAYVAYQASAYLMDTPVISELNIILKWGCDKREQLEVIKLILNKPELQATLTEAEFSKLIQMRHELAEAAQIS